MNKSNNKRTNRERLLREGNGENNVSQILLSEENRWNFKNGFYLESGLGFETNSVLIRKELNNESLINEDTRLNRLFVYLQQYWPLTKSVELNTGFRANYAFGLNRFYPEPRLEATIKITDELKINAAWGLYHQFLSKTTLVDSTLNYYYFWVNADNKAIPVLSAQHSVGGISYNKKGWTASLESYYKTTSGLSRFVNGTNLIPRGFYKGESHSYGVDLFLKKEYKENVAWVSYSWSKTDEHFPFYIHEYYHPAPQDQRHELKFAGILNYKSFYFSASYVFGSGFERFVLADEKGEDYIPAYNRLDAAVIYNFKPGKVKSQIGISVLNVLNNENVKLSSIRRIATDTENSLDVNTEATPFTPTLFLKMQF